MFEVHRHKRFARPDRTGTFGRQPLLLSVISLLVVIGALVPATARASVLSVILNAIRLNIVQADTVSTSGNVQTMALLRPAMNIDPVAGRGGGDITIVDDSALMPAEGPSGTIADIEKPKNGTISTYIVQQGDTLGSIAKLFDVTSNTILWANNLSSGSKLRVGQSLVILPVTGIKYTVKKGDTLASIAKKYGGNADEIGSYNGIDASSLAVGADIIIPDGEIALAVPVKKSSAINEPAHNVGPQGSPAQIGYYIAPLQPGTYKETQGIHGYNAVDLAPYGDVAAPILAAADGDVVVAKAGGWNGGYGSYVVVSHGNGSQTLYSHMSKVAAYDGEHVVQGQVIGYVGRTGKATGSHVHFEIRNGIKNPF